MRARLDWPRVPALVAATAIAAPAAAQRAPRDEAVVVGDLDYAKRYGEPVFVALEDLAWAPELYRDRAVRTRGRLQGGPSFGRDGPGTSGPRHEVQSIPRMFGLRGGLHSIDVCPATEDLAGELALPEWSGRMIEVVGVLVGKATDPLPDRSEPVCPPGSLRTWAFTDWEEHAPRARSTAPALRQVVSDPDGHGRETVRVLGQFGGADLLGQMPAGSRPDAAAWVLRDGEAAVWVVGRRPEGRGFKLDPAYAADTGRWLEVEGRIERCGEALCLRARRVALATRPSSNARP